MTQNRTDLPVLPDVLPGSVLVYAGRGYCEYRLGAYSYVVVEPQRRAAYEE